MADPARPGPEPESEPESGRQPRPDRPDPVPEPHGPDEPVPETHEPEAHESFHERLEHFEEAAIAAEMASGRHEETVEEAKRGLLKRLARMTAGFFLVGLGLALLVLPGPGLIVLASGLVILSVDVPFAARLLDKVRARLPADEDGNVPKHVIFGGLAVSLVAVMASLWWTFLR